MPIVTELGHLIDCTEEEFREFCKNKDLGYISSFHNLLVQTFNEVQKIKDELISVMSNNPELRDSEQSTLQGLYSKLMRIEQRVFILREVIKERSV